MPKVPTVLQVLPALVTGGVERGAIDIAIAINKIGWTSLVASSGGPMVVELERAGVEHIKMCLATKKPWIMHRNAGKLASLIFDRKVDIVHARSRAPAWSAYFASKRMGCHFVTTFHGTYNAQNAIKKFYNSVMTRGERVIAISEFIAGHVRSTYGVPLDRVSTVRRGIDTTIYDPKKVAPERIVSLAQSWRLPDGVPVIMLPGRLTRWKGHETLIQALSQLERKDVCCLLVGSDQGRTSYRRELESMISRFQLETVVQVVDQCNDMPAAYMLADVVVSASTDPEAFGRVAIEAQAMGRPVVASDHGGTRETVIEGVTGWLFKPGDSTSLAESLTQALIMDQFKRADVAGRARAHVLSKFSLNSMESSTLQIYQNVLTDS